MKLFNHLSWNWSSFEHVLDMQLLVLTFFAAAKLVITSITLNHIRVIATGPEVRESDISIDPTILSL